MKKNYFIKSLKCRCVIFLAVATTPTGCAYKVETFYLPDNLEVSYESTHCGSVPDGGMSLDLPNGLHLQVRATPIRGALGLDIIASSVYDDSATDVILRDISIQSTDGDKQKQIYEKLVLHRTGIFHLDETKRASYINSVIPYDNLPDSFSLSIGEIVFNNAIVQVGEFGFHKVTKSGWMRCIQ